MTKLIYVADDLPGISRKRAGRGASLPLVRKRGESDLAARTLTREERGLIALLEGAPGAREPLAA